MVYQRLPNGKFPGENPGSMINPLGRRSYADFLAMSVILGRRADSTNSHGIRFIRQKPLGLPLSGRWRLHSARQLNCDSSSRGI